MQVLITGNTGGYITEGFIVTAFPDADVHVLGNPLLKTNKWKKIDSQPIPESAQDYQYLFDAYEFDCVVYYSNFLTLHGKGKGEIEQLRTVMQCCAGKKDLKFIYLTGPEGEYDHETGKTVVVHTMEEFCLNYAEIKGINVKIIQCPYMCSGVYQTNYFYRIFKAMDENEVVPLPEAGIQKAFFIDRNDLADLLYRVSGKWDNEAEVLNIPDVFNLTFADLARRLEKLKPGVRVVCTGKAVIQHIVENDKVLRNKYGWFPKISVMHFIESMYQDYQNIYKSQHPFMDRLREVVLKHRGLWIVLELIACFFLVEWLIHLVGDSIQFSMIDFRLLYIVIFATIYGMNYGLVAALLESLSLIWANTSQGMNWMVLFYEPTNWLPFIGYFIVGAVCGYVRIKARDEIALIKDENKLIIDRFDFLQGMYQDVLHDKREYKKQIINSRDSFGKLYDITNQLDVVEVQELYMKTLEVMEDALDNQSVAIYTLEKNRKHAQLAAASRATYSAREHAIVVDDYEFAVPALEKGDIWANTELEPGLPMYIAGIKQHGSIVMLIMIFEAAYDQTNLYYQNRFKILCGLVERALLRVYDYKEARRKEECIGDTDILKEKYFLQQLHLYHDMRERHIGEYTLVQMDIKGRNLQDVDDFLNSKIREQDVVGQSSDGYVYIIITHMEEAAVQWILDSFRKDGYDCKVVVQLTPELERKE